MTRINILILFLILSQIVLNGQNTEQRIEQIDLKLDYDMDYLNVKYLVFKLSEMDGWDVFELPREKREALKLSDNENISYKLLFLDEGIEVSEIYPLRIEKIEHKGGSDSNVLGNLESASTDTSMVYSFADFYRLSQNNKTLFDQICESIKKYVLINGKDSYFSTLKINLDETNYTALGFVSPDNSDFISFNRANSVHWLPKEEKKVRSFGFSRRKTITTSDYNLHLSLSNISFSYKPILSLSNTSGASVEINTEEKLQNLLPWYANTINAMARIIISPDNNQNVNDAYYVIAKAGYRLSYDNSAIMSNAPKLNFSDAIIFETNLTRPFGIPFFTFGASVAISEEPGYKLPAEKDGFYYYTQNSVYSYFSYYWNTSESKSARFSIDVGAGYHDIFRTDKIKRGAVHHIIQPIIGINYIFNFNGRPFIGASSRFYDLVLKSKVWVNLISIGNHEGRVGIQHLTEPLFRKIKPWEMSGGVFFDLSWRYGLN